MDYLEKIKPGLRVFWRNTPTKSIQITIWGELGWGPYHLPRIFLCCGRRGKKTRALCKHQRHAVIMRLPASWFSCTSTLEACNRLQGLHLHWRNLNDFFVAQTVSRAFMKKKCNTEGSKDEQDMIYHYIYTWTFQFRCQMVPLQGVNSPSLRV